MTASLWRHKSLTVGERRLVLAYVTVSLFGAALALSIVIRLGHGGVLMGTMTGYEFWMLLAGAAGAGAGLFLSRDRFGWPGLRGTGQALGGMLMVCFSGSLIAGTLALPLYGTMFGPFTLGVVLASSPLLTLLWVATLYGAHLMLQSWRAERNSIFAVPHALHGGRVVRAARPSPLPGNSDSP
jgi:hypothetical protein